MLRFEEAGAGIDSGEGDTNRGAVQAPRRDVGPSQAIPRPVAAGGLALRTYRALTWLHYARSETQDQFTPFVYYWIAFNALYAVDSDNADENERQAQEKYFARLLSGEGAQKLVAGALGGLEGRVHVLMNETPGHASEKDTHDVARGISNGYRTSYVLREVAKRLYSIRNWVFHGGWHGRATSCADA